MVQHGAVGELYKPRKSSDLQNYTIRRDFPMQAPVSGWLSIIHSLTMTLQADFPPSPTHWSFITHRPIPFCNQTKGLLLQSMRIAATTASEIWTVHYRFAKDVHAQDLTIWHPCLPKLFPGKVLTEDSPQRSCKNVNFRAELINCPEPPSTPLPPPPLSSCQFLKCMF